MQPRQAGYAGRPPALGTLAASGFVADPESSRLGARWAYRQATAAGAMGWVSGRSVEPLPPGVVMQFDIAG